MRLKLWLRSIQRKWGLGENGAERGVPRDQEQSQKSPNDDQDRAKVKEPLERIAEAINASRERYAEDNRSRDEAEAKRHRKSLRYQGTGITITALLSAATLVVLAYTYSVYNQQARIMREQAQSNVVLTNVSFTITGSKVLVNLVLFNEGGTNATIKLSESNSWDQNPPVDFDPFSNVNDPLISLISDTEARIKALPKETPESLAVSEQKQNLQTALKGYKFEEAEQNAARQFVDNIPAKHTGIYQFPANCGFVINGKCMITQPDPKQSFTLFAYGNYEFWDSLVTQHRTVPFCRKFPPDLNGASVSCLRPSEADQQQ